MKTESALFCIAFLTASFLLASCSMDKGDRRDSNLEQAVLTRLDSIPNVEYVGVSDVHTLDDNRLQSVVIYYVTDSIGNRVERNAQVTINEDCSEIFVWEDLDSNVLGETMQTVRDRSLIDALIELKKR